MDLKPKRSLGQNFLNDPNTIRKIINSLKADQNDQVIEIGPGTGALTEELIKSYKDLTVIEIDKRAVEFLKKRFSNLHVVHQDILKVNWEEIVNIEKPTFIIGNLPYNITSPILFNLLDNRTLFTSAIIMMQKEVALRLVAKPRTKEYGILSVQIQLTSTVNYEFSVSRNVFKPKPDVDSAIVSLNFNKPPLQCQFDHLKYVVRTAFNQRRKKLSNALKNIIPKNYGLDFDLSRRAEELTPKEFEKLTILLEETGLMTN